jgi:hypothetical protein
VGLWGCDDLSTVGAPLQQAGDFFVAKAHSVNGFETGHLEHNLAVRVDEKTGGSAIYTVSLYGPFEVASALQRRETVIAHDFHSALRLAGHEIDSDDVEVLRFVFVENLLQARKLRAAPLSTREPEVNEDYLAAKIGELNLLTGDVLREVERSHGLGFGLACLPHIIVDLLWSLPEFRAKA